MLRRVRASVRRMPAAHRLLSVTALLLTAAAANTVAHAGPVARWLPLLVVAVIGATLAGAPTRAWPLPAIWLVATLLVASTGSGVDGRAAAVSVAVGGVALLAAAAVDVVPVVRSRRRVRP